MIAAEGSPVSGISTVTGVAGRSVPPVSTIGGAPLPLLDAKVTVCHRLLRWLYP